MIKLIAIDIDGTLIDSNLTIPDENFKAIRRAIDQGVKVVLCTGRPTNGSIDETKKLCLYGNDGYLITYHGAVTTKLDTMERVTEHTISYEGACELMAFSQRVGSEAYAIDAESMNTINGPISDLAKRESKLMKVTLNQAPLEEWDQTKTYEKFMMMDAVEVIDRAEEMVTDDLHKKYTILRSDPHFLEFINKEADKGTAVAELAQKLDIPLDQVMGIGDGGNDLHLIETVGLGVAMDNAVPALKDLADHITASNDQAGVAKAIEKFVLN